MRKIRTHKFNGVVYHIEVDDPFVAWCDNPNKKKNKAEYPAIRLADGLPFGDEDGARDGLMTLIHECLHAEDYKMSEEKVDRIAVEIGRLLWRLGYRRKK